jgi:hypothetical protein
VDSNSFLTIELPRHVSKALSTHADISQIDFHLLCQLSSLIHTLMKSINIEAQLAHCQLVEELEILVRGIDLKLIKFYMNFKEALKLLPAERLSNKSLLTTKMLFMRL